MVLALVFDVQAADYNFYQCSDNSSLETSFNISFNQAESNQTVCVNSTGLSSTNFAINISGFGDFVYDNWNFSVSAQDNTGEGITTNGTHFWIVGNQNRRVYRYMANGTYDNWFFSVITQALIPYGITTNGTHFWVVDTNSKRVYRYRADGTYDNWNFSVSAQDTALQGITTNGTHFWIMGDITDRVYRYMANGTYDNWNFSVNAQTTGPSDITTNGTHFWVVSSTIDRVHRYRADGTYDNWDFSVREQDNLPRGIVINGTDFWIVGRDTDRVYRYKDYGGYILNLSFDINNDSTNEWSMTDELNSTNSPQWTSGVAAGTIIPGGMIVLNWTSDTAGILELSGINWGPAITATSPADEFSTLNTSITLNATATDPDNTTLNYYYYNGTDFIATATGAYVWNASLVENGTIYWRVQVDDGIQNSTFSTNSTIYLLFPPDNCPAGTNNELKILTFNLINEETLAAMTSGFIGAVLTITHNDTEATFSVSNSSIASLDICLNNVYLGDLVDVDTTFHNGSTWPLGSWYIRGQTINSTTITHSLGLLNTTYTTESFIYIIDDAGNQAQDFFVTLLVYDYATSQWQTLRMSRTDGTGKAVFFLRQSDRYYSFYVYDESLTFLQTFSNYIISTLETTLQIDISAFGYLPSALINVDSTCTFPTNASINCTVTDNNDPLRVTQTILKTWEGGAVNFTLDCTDTSTSNPATVSCAVDPTEVYFYVLKVDMNPPMVLTSGFLGSFPQDDYGAIGIFTLAILALAMGFAGSYNPQIFVLLMFIAFVMGSVIGLISPTSGMTFSLIATLTMIVIWRLKTK